jgi:hypothetical protein
MTPRGSETVRMPGGCLMMRDIFLAPKRSASKPHFERLMRSFQMRMYELEPWLACGTPTQELSDW